MNCQVCRQEVDEHQIQKVNWLKESYELCFFCAADINSLVKARINNIAININWGGGKIGFGCWGGIRDFMRERNIKDVLEIGTGLSTELFVNEGIKVTSLDFLENHSNMFKRHINIGAVAEIIYYPGSDHLPDLGGRTWDFVFVDSPHERSREVKLAMKVANKWICLHDPNLGEQSFFPNEEWKEIQFKYYERVKKDV